MSTGGTGAIAAVRALRETIEAAAAALAEPRVDALLACEAAMEVALTRLQLPGGIDAGERETIRRELEATRGALERCRRLGESLSEFIRLSFDAYGCRIAYDSPEPVYAGQALDRRV